LLLEKMAFGISLKNRGKPLCGGPWQENFTLLRSDQAYGLLMSTNSGSVHATCVVEREFGERGRPGVPGGRAASGRFSSSLDTAEQIAQAESDPQSALGA